jgi:hypothetical protein
MPAAPFARGLHRFVLVGRGLRHIHHMIYEQRIALIEEARAARSREQDHPQ